MPGGDAPAAGRAEGHHRAPRGRGERGGGEAPLRVQARRGPAYEEGSGRVPQGERGHGVPDEDPGPAAEQARRARGGGARGAGEEDSRRPAHGGAVRDGTVSFATRFPIHFP